MALTNKTFNDYDVTGINGSNVDYMKLKINDYKTNIDEILNKINNLIDTEYTIGFRGNQILNIRTYINDVINECKRMNSFFEDFEYTLDKIKQNYESKSTNPFRDDSSVKSLNITREDLSDVRPFSQ